MSHTMRVLFEELDDANAAYLEARRRLRDAHLRLRNVYTDSVRDNDSGTSATIRARARYHENAYFKYGG